MCMRGHGREPGPGRGDPARAAHAVVPQHLVLGPGRPRRRARASSADGGTLRRRAPRPGRLVLAGDGAPERAVLRQRDQRRAAVGRCRSVAVPEGRHQRPRGARRRHGQPRPDRHQGARCSTRSTCPAGGHRRDPAAAGQVDPTPAARPRAPGSTSARLRRRDGARRAEADEFFAELTPLGTAPTRRWSCGRPGRDDVGQAVLPLRRRAAGSTATRPAAAAGRPAARPQRRVAAPGQADVISMPDPWEYPWFAAWDLAFHCVRDRPRRPGVRQEAAAAGAARVVHAPQRADAGVRVGLRRREPAGARVGRAAGLRDRRVARPRLPGQRVFHKLLLNFTWWVNRKDSRRQQHLRGRLPRAGQHRPDRPLGAAAGGRRLEQSDGTGWMAMYASTCWRWRSSWPSTTRAYEDMATKFLEHFAYIADGR